MITDWLGLGPLMTDYLISKNWLDINRIQVSKSLEEVQDGNEPVPAVHVLYADFQIVDDITEGMFVAAQFWDVIAVLHQADRNMRSLNAAGGELTLRAMVALAGWRAPGGEYSPLQPEPGLVPVISDDDALGYFPMRYRTRFTIKSDSGFLASLPI